MKRLFSLYILVSLFSLTFIIKGFHEMTPEKEHEAFSLTEQLPELDSTVYITQNLLFPFSLGADEGIAVPQGRRFGLNKPPKNPVLFRNNINDGKDKLIKSSFTENKRLFIQYLTTRHSQGFYIYTLKELLL